MAIDMNERMQQIFRLVVDSYLDDGKPVGSKGISEHVSLSSATVRNTMQDLEHLGLLYAPHTSAGRMPTQSGLRLFVDSMMEVRDLRADVRQKIDNIGNTSDQSLDRTFESASALVSGLSSCASIIAIPKLDRKVRQIQFSHLGDKQTLAIIVFEDGSIENRIIHLPNDVEPTSLISASNYLNAMLIRGETITQTRNRLLREIKNNKSDLDTLSQKLIEDGLAEPDKKNGTLFVRGRAEILNEPNVMNHVEEVRHLMDMLDQQETVASMLEAAETGQPFGIFIGSENRLFKHSGLSMIVAPALNENKQTLGVVGVIGPTNMNYGRVVPVVDYTSQVIARLIG